MSPTTLRSRSGIARELWTRLRFPTRSQRRVAVFIAALLPGIAAAPGAAQDLAWTEAARPGNTHVYGAAVLLRDGRVLVFGGGSQPSVGSYTHPRPEFLEANLYDPATDTWSRAAAVPGVALSPQAITIPDGRVVAFGVGASRTSPRPVLYDPKRDAWRRGRAIPSPRFGPGLALLGDGRLLVAGGADPGNRARATVDVYDPVHDSWRPAGSLRTARYGPAAVVLRDGHVLIAGGSVPLKSPPYSRWVKHAELYDPHTNRWTSAGDVPFGTARSAFVAVRLVALQDGRAMAFVHSDTEGDALALFDPATTAWSLAIPWHIARVHAAVVPLPDGRILVAGGEVASGPTDCSVIAGTELYDPATDTWTVGPPTRSARASAHAVVLVDGRVMMIGGTHPDAPNLCGLYAASGAGGGSEILDAVP